MASDVAQESGVTRSTRAATQQAPPSKIDGAPAPAATRSSPWTEYLDRLAGLCGAEAVGPPSADLLRPPTDLLAHPDIVGPTPAALPRRQQPGSTAAAAGAGAAAAGGSSGAGAAGAGAVAAAGGGSPGARNGGSSGGPDLPATANVGSAAGLDLLPSTSDRVLVLLDMNGTLLYRAKKPLRAAAAPGGGGSEEAAAAAAADSAAAAVAAAVAFVHGDPDPFQYYMRPGADQLVAAMHRHPRVRLAFYTSMRGVNALPAARFLMPDHDHGEGTDGAPGAPPPEVYDRPFNARDPHGVNPWDTTRDLPLIWSTAGRAGAGFGPENTVMVDDTPKKMRFMDAGLVVVPEFTGGCVLETLELRAEAGEGRGGGEEARAEAARGQREVLPRLVEYLGRLLEESGPDVRPFIESNPFQPRDPSFSLSVSVSPKSRSGRSASLASSPAAAAAATPVPRFSIVEAVELVLTTGPLCRRERRSGGGASSLSLSAAVVVGSSGAADQGRAMDAAGGGGRGSSTFEGFGRGVQVSVVEAVVELLRAATAAAERWGLGQQERGTLQAWSRAAAAAAAAAGGAPGGAATAGAC